MTLYRLTLTTLATLMLGACASTSMQPLPDGLSDQPPAGWSDRQQALSSVRHWQLQGKLAVRQPSDSGTAIINRWTQDNEHYRLSLSSAFLGLGRTELAGVPGYLELTLPDGETYRSNNPQDLIHAATGWQLPIDSLTWWIKGLPSPGDNFQLLFNTSGQLAVIRQQGWEIRYERWQTFTEQLPTLPARITALKGDKRVRLAITDWQPKDPEPF
ncbi:lipoprotein insertase outer membrane protein LolB [Marinobacter caseinilyticus]|uniref:lipoprotein insertase outer membrane protein LolB n=1 Tax=Marinobacter caseinilyticus TaxID=2692195 RepID=UPI001F3031CA|nr:lipoprotein insertase outer membrane protein LolB [Marinobacter caseinilyticus]